ncbi:hypothetical protein SISSUDRAFT_1053137 [Sistotremastrum suecicum HHB10207 ss-3]|uniref:Uncharacterized protein n=1 Tax=Sistotremastrum suecicum HHB10207 ss-3 TaxID=1314776 RepID=A0A165ZE55_9AGAM|nr:hypothetical protein SISSUDRAFT_1053137 [Sistotremastrum suecicum HHB10207 ss-3]
MSGSIDMAGRKKTCCLDLDPLEVKLSGHVSARGHVGINFCQCEVMDHSLIESYTVYHGTPKGKTNGDQLTPESLINFMVKFSSINSRLDQSELLEF